MPMILTLQHKIMPDLGVRYLRTFLESGTTTGGPIGRRVVCSGPSSCFLFYNSSPPYLYFLLLTNDTNIGGLTSNVILFFTIVIGVFNIGLSVQSTKCVTWSPQGLNNFISLPPSFLPPNPGFHILGTPMGFISFVELFVVKTLHEDLDTIFCFSMLAYL